MCMPDCRNGDGRVLGAPVQYGQNAAMTEVGHLKSEIAATAARLIVDEGFEYGRAKQRALKALNLPPRTALPGNEDIEDAVREYIALFCADTQPAELAALRRVALLWMDRMAEFRPYLAGAVWHGTATRLSDVRLLLFCDDAKSAEIFLINSGVHFETRSVPGLRGREVEDLSLLARCDELGESVIVHLLVHDHDALRGALKPDAKGRAPLGSRNALAQLLALTEGEEAAP